MPDSINVDHATVLVSGVTGLSASSDISRGSVATHLRCGWICSDSFITNCVLILTVKILKIDLIFGEVIRRTINGAIFGPPCIHKYVGAVPRKAVHATLTYF